MNRMARVRRAELGDRSPWSAADPGALALVAFAWAAFSVLPARALVSAYMGDPSYSHGFIVPIVAAILAWRARTRYFLAERGQGSWGFVSFVLGCGLVVFGHWYRIALHPGYLGHVFLQGTGLWVALASLVWILAGRRRFRVLAPVLGFLVFAVPWPESFMLPLTTALQRMVAVSSAHLLRALGVEVFREGNLLQLHSAVLGVAEACSGIRSLLAFFATAAACALFLGLGAWRTLLLFALAPVAAVGSNILRILATSFLVLLGGDMWLEGTLHDMMGLAVVILGGGVLFAVAQHLVGGAPRSPTAAQIPRLPTMPPPRLWPAAAAASALLLASTLGMLHVSLHYESMVHPDSYVPAARRPLAEFPHAIGPYRCTDESRLSAKELANLRPSEHLVRTYEDPQGNWLLLTVLYWDAQRTYPGSSALARYPHDPNGCMLGAGWSRETAYDSVASPDWVPDGQLHAGGFVKADREHLVLYWNNKPEEYPRPFSPKDLRQRWRILVQSWNEVPESILPATYGVRVETDIEGQPAAADETTREFARQVAEVLPDFGIGRRDSIDIVED